MTIPAVAYFVVEKFILHLNTAVMGASIWVFLVLAVEALRTYKTNPFFEIAGFKIPTWTTPLALVLFTWALIPRTSLLGHLCGMGTGYLCKLLPFAPSLYIDTGTRLVDLMLTVCPSRSWIPEASGAARETSPVD